MIMMNRDGARPALAVRPGCHGAKVTVPGPIRDGLACQPASGNHGHHDHPGIRIGPVEPEPVFHNSDIRATEDLSEALAGIAGPTRHSRPGRRA
jgi:hypothetical protein